MHFQERGNVNSETRTEDNDITDIFQVSIPREGGIVGTNNTSGINDRCRNCFGSSALFSNVD